MRQNLARHYRKVHPRSVSSLLQQKLETGPSRGLKIRRPRRILLYALISLAIILVGIVAAQIISANTVRLRLRTQLSILIEGAPFTVPSNIGIDRTLWKDHSLDQYGVGGKSPLLTTDNSGAIHVESNTLRNFTLHDFLRVWGESIDYSQVVGNSVQPGKSACILVNGEVIPAVQDVILADQQKIALEIISGDCSAVS